MFADRDIHFFCVNVKVVFEISNVATDPLNAENLGTSSFLSRNGVRVTFPFFGAHLNPYILCCL
jgi:hypothetical protein